MYNINRNELLHVTIEWNIKNFHFCWHKTGERLESPAFNVEFARGTSWRLWLYPRGDDDGEYLSFYLFREEGGPEVVHADFILYFCLAKNYIIYSPTFKGCSFNVLQKEGIKCFVRRCEIRPHENHKNNSYLLRLGCRISNSKNGRFGGIFRILWTTIGMERVYGTEICDNLTELAPHCNKDIEVKPMLENEPLININLSYFEDSLVIKMLPVNCKKIKYAICKVAIINNWGKESAIEHIRSWIGEIKKDIWRCVLRPEAESFKPELKSFTDKTFFVHYDFAFSTGEIVLGGVEQSDEFLMTTNVSYQQYLNAKSPKFAKTALDVLEEIYRSKSFTDICVKTSEKTFPAHKAILCSRSPKFKSVIKKDTTEVSMECHGFYCKDLLQFLYTDNFTNSQSISAVNLYKLSFSMDLELLKTQMRNLIVRNLHPLRAVNMLCCSVDYRDSFFKAAVENYIITHYDYVLSKTVWKLHENRTALRKDLILSKYKKTTSSTLGVASKINN